MQGAGRSFAIKVHYVTLGDDSELGEVQMSVQTLKRVVSPRDLVKTLLQHTLALSELQIKAGLKVSVRGPDREHV